MDNAISLNKEAALEMDDMDGFSNTKIRDILEPSLSERGSESE